MIIPCNQFSRVSHGESTPRFSLVGFICRSIRNTSACLRLNVNGAADFANFRRGQLITSSAGVSVSNSKGRLNAPPLLIVRIRAGKRDFAREKCRQLLSVLLTLKLRMTTRACTSYREKDCRSAQRQNTTCSERVKLRTTEGTESKTEKNTRERFQFRKLWMAKAVDQLMGFVGTRSAVEFFVRWTKATAN